MDVRNGRSTYTMIISPDSPHLPEHDGEWLLEQNEWGAFKLHLSGSSRYLTAHRRAHADTRGPDATFACVINRAGSLVPSTDGRWIFEKVAN
mmetsp:Transcript_35693/g.78173  ORF Transcript_35693/g.78173 Transcript_35693/m.78173 type:complete len:92 (-) Transcript_35693:261-536(-)